MKKLLAIGGIIVVIFVLIVVLNNQSNKKKLADNPYGTNDLDQSTIDILSDKNYQSIALPDEVDKQIESGEPTTVYFFSPDCPHCREMTPRLMPLADKYDAHIYQYNMKEFGDQAESRYGIESWPTLVHYKDGKEQGRMSGAHPDEDIKAFFDEFESN